ncbi:DUF1236 domain-containing protein [Neorhizobium galegae]|uniref:DUF1236 domain-containing protein n=1 Tax=Neorhizobium galegae TaxID=399 RepID=UPI0006228D48|nr:DUF1236 domain-containing protein [Neorhizobium galegae]CDZ29113.1 Mg chelatase, cobalamin biosynthesis protein CobN [Neorhizobium galegae bv. officinalis]KAA9383997.1 DUF1236 domain-containing protein [Neorhizobium galegae]MCM2496705.1 DUF1236 domain-containing protein [Neorhizobium galegae]MCQ1775632.1 DUF1236 domain-containing protein [Neorhizobium galegae]MCQ1798099.1 DUF1236 domain-containing protein [Neorhizobium galegae]
MRLFDRKALLVALLAGSTLSLPALAQNSSSGSADPRLLPKEGTSKQGSASGSQGTKATTPEAGASSQSAGGNGPEAKQQPAQKQAQSEQLRKPGEAGSGASKDAQNAATKESQSKTGTDSAQTGDQRKNMNQDAAAGSSADQTKQSAQGSGTSTEKKDMNAAGSNTQTSSDTNTAIGTQQRQSSETTAASADRPSNEVTGSINISTEQKTEIRNVIVENKVEPIKPSFSVSVGVAVPKTVELHPLPPRVVEILPAYRSYRYFVLADNRIVIVEPDTYEIVYILVV